MTNIIKGIGHVIVFLLVDSTDFVTAETGKTPTVQLSKNGGAFANVTNSVSEIANGWYKVTLTTTETNTAGPLVVRATATGCAEWRALFWVYDAALLKADVSGLATAASVTTLTGYVDTEVAAIKSKTDNLPAAPAATGDIPTAAAIADGVWDEAISGHSTPGSTGAALIGAGGGASAPTAAQIVSALLNQALGTYAAGTVGKRLVDVALAQQLQAAQGSGGVGGTMANIQPIRQHSTYVASIYGIGDMTDFADVVFMVKADADDADSEALVAWRESAGLQRLNGQAATAGDGALVVADTDDGDISLTLKPAATGALAVGSYPTAVKVFYEDGSMYELRRGVMTVEQGYIEATS